MPRQSRILAKQQLQSLYAEQGFSMAAVAHRTDTNVASVRYWLVEHGIALRSSGAFRHHGSRAVTPPAATAEG